MTEKIEISYGMCYEMKCIKVQTEENYFSYTNPEICNLFKLSSKDAFKYDSNFKENIKKIVYTV